jgi:hypothetical protein
MLGVLLLLLSFSSAFVQLDHGQIAGTVSDPSRDAVNAAQVAVVSAQTGRRISTNANERNLQLGIKIIF